MRFIDADDIKCENRCIQEKTERGFIEYPLKRLLDEQPTAEPKRGRWIKSETSEAFDIAGVKTWALKAKCSECGFVHKFIEAHMCYGYCPQCGAAMMEGGDTDA